jgi:tRNA pseudouridine55 synthase
LTSAAVVSRLRHSTGVRRIGHGGTLDPAATGVLPIFLGRATLLTEFLSRQGKAYLAGIRIGSGSETDDAEGELISVPVPEDVDFEAVAAALQTFAGDLEQQPPAFSAVKLDGERSYRRARRGDLQRPPARTVRVDSIRLEELRNEEAGLLAVVEIECGPGFYVRALARDLGARLGTEAHLAWLRRTRVGGLRLDDAIALPDVEAAGADIGRFLRPAAEAMRAVTAVRVGESAVDDLRLGRSVPVAAGATAQAYATDSAGRVLALGRVLGGQFHPHRLVDV